MAIDPEIFARVATAFNIAVIAFQMMFMMTVPLQFTPTNAYLPPENVTCYATHLPLDLANPAITDVGGFEYTLLILDLLRWFVPLIFFMVLALALNTGSSAIAWVTLVVFGLFFLEELIKFVIRIDEYWFCSDWQICPRCSAPDFVRCAPEDTSCPHNYLYKWIFWSNFVWLFLIVLYMILTGIVAYVAKTHAENKERTRNAFLEANKDQSYVSTAYTLEKSLEKKLR